MFPKINRYGMAQGYCLDTTGRNGKVYTNSKSNYKSKYKSKYNTTTRRTSNNFFTEFAVETDIFTEENSFPEWIYDFREDLLSKLSPSMKKVCRNLKNLKIGFKIKYPVEIFGKWKFADIYIPKKKTVIIVTSSFKHQHHPCNVLPERAEFFKDRFRVIDLYEYNAGDMDYLKKRLMVQ